MRIALGNGYVLSMLNPQLTECAPVTMQMQSCSAAHNQCEQLLFSAHIPHAPQMVSPQT